MKARPQPLGTVLTVILAAGMGCIERSSTPMAKREGGSPSAARASEGKGVVVGGDGRAIDHQLEYA